MTTPHTTAQPCCNHDCCEGRACPKRTSASAYTCDALGVCQNREPACAGCMNYVAHARYPFAPGVISGSDGDLHGLDAGWPLALHWYDWLAGAAIVVVVGAIAGWAN